MSYELNQMLEGRVIAQHDDQDWEESGYVVWYWGDIFRIDAYSHCSCYGTWTSIFGRSVSENADKSPDSYRSLWQGSADDLVAMAKRCSDPAMPERVADVKDSDFDHLQGVYEQVIAWDSGGRKLPNDLFEKVEGL